MRRQLLRFGVVGIANVAIDTSIYLILRGLGVDLFAANAVSTSAGLLFSFFANRRFTFAAHGSAPFWRQALLFLVIVGFGLWAIQPVVIQLVTPWLHSCGLSDGYVLLGAKLVAIAVGLVWNFLLMRFVVFRRRPAVTEAGARSAVSGRVYRPVYEHHGFIDVVLEAYDEQSGGEDRRFHRLIAGTGRGVVVLARQVKSQRERVLLVASTRSAAGERLLELPRGWVEQTDGENVAGFLAAAQRELVEETGLLGTDFRTLGTFVLDSSIYPQRVAVVSCSVPDQAEGPTDGEVDHTRWVAAGDIELLVSRGEIRDAISLAALAIWSSAASANRS